MTICLKVIYRTYIYFIILEFMIFFSLNTSSSSKIANIFQFQCSLCMLPQELFRRIMAEDNCQPPRMYLLNAESRGPLPDINKLKSKFRYSNNRTINMHKIVKIMYIQSQEIMSHHEFWGHVSPFVLATLSRFIQYPYKCMLP